MLKTGDLFGDRAFYRQVLTVMLPILAQNIITNLIGSLDNMMVGLVGQSEMAGVGVINQLLGVFQLCLFGMVSGAAIFGAQAYGRRDHDGVRHVLRFTLYAGLLLYALVMAVLLLFGDGLISFYLPKDEGGDPQAIRAFASEYLAVILIGLLPYTLAQVYGGTLRATGNTLPPMVAALSGILSNLILNYLMIYGHLGLPAMGVRGAALATVIARLVECAVVLLCAHLGGRRYPFIRGVYASPRIPSSLVRGILLRGMPLMVNEAVYAMGMATLTACYAARGGDTLPALTITSTLCDLVTYLFISAGSATAVLLGHILGKGEEDVAKKTATRLITFTLGMGFLCALLLLIAAPVFPGVMEATDSVRRLATGFILIRAAVSPVLGYLNGCYFTILSGGQTVVIFFLDSVFIWSVNVLLAFLLATYTALPILAVYAIATFADLLKAAIGTVLVARGRWARCVVAETGTG